MIDMEQSAPKITAKNFYLCMRDQFPFKRFMRNLLKGNLRGLWHIRSHIKHGGGNKITYNTKATATKAAKDMAVKRGVYFSNYKCMYCDGYHIGKHHEDRHK